MRNYKKFSKKASALFLSLIVTMTSTIALPSTISAANIKLNKTAATIQVADTPTAKARWVLMYIHFQIYSKVYKTNEFP